MSLRERKAAKKKEDILRSASLVISRQGFHNATMEEIAAELLMTKGSLYYYFNSKQELLFHCHDLILSDAIAEMSSICSESISATDKLNKAIKLHLEIAIREKEVFNMINKPEQIFSEEHVRLIVQRRDEYAGFFDSIIKEGVNKGEFAVKEQRMVRMIILGATNWVQVWYSPKGEYTKDQIKEIYAEHLVKMVVG